MQVPRILRETIDNVQRGGASRTGQTRTGQRSGPYSNTGAERQSSSYSNANAEQRSSARYAGRTSASGSTRGQHAETGRSQRTSTRTGSQQQSDTRQRSASNSGRDWRTEQDSWQETGARRTERTSSSRSTASASRSTTYTSYPPENASPRRDERRAPSPSPQSRYTRDFITRWRMYGVAAFAAIMVLGGVIGLLFFLRPTTSAVEMRNLTQYPEFTVESFLNGSYFTEVSLWYADTYPLREPMVAADHAIDSLFGINTGTGMVGGNVQADEIPVEEEKVDFSPVVPPANPPNERTVAEDIQENIMEGVYVKDGSGYSIYYFSQYAADTYVTAMNTAAEKLNGIATVYSIMAPANSITLPEDEALRVGGSDQQQTLEYLSTRFDTRVKAVDLIDIIKEHSDEYLYFHTDHHWTQLGAYYGYVAFCEQKGVEPKSLSDWRYVNLGAFRGTYSDTVESMGYTVADEVEAYVPASTNAMTYWTSYGDEIEGSVIDEAAIDWDPSYKYSAFIAGDQPLEIIHNSKLDDGSSCLVVKDSYGCAFVPCLVDQYETIYVIDFRETDKNICDYAKEKNVQDVIFMTGIKIGLTDSVAETLLSEVS